MAEEEKKEDQEKPASRTPVPGSPTPGGPGSGTPLPGSPTPGAPKLGGPIPEPPEIKKPPGESPPVPGGEPSFFERVKDPGEEKPKPPEEKPKAPETPEPAKEVEEDEKLERLPEPGEEPPAEGTPPDEEVSPIGEPVEPKKEKNPIVAAILSFFIPGVGQIYNGQIGRGIILFLTGGLVVPWVYSVFNAYKTAKRINAGEPLPGKKGMVISIVVPAGLGVVAAVLFFVGKVEKKEEPAKPVKVMPAVMPEVFKVPEYNMGNAGITRYTYKGETFMNFSTDDSIDKIVKFYRTEVNKMGCSITSDNYKPGLKKAKLVFTHAGKPYTLNLRTRWGTTKGELKYRK
ncbi:unnamed protein product [marine sediment metagenome]|uniref:TM2 domain-containing protein n=1 Tax=marine sediment metagenome TaxID=412755 RepID=X0SCH1_9ZZZZ